MFACDADTGGGGSVGTLTLGARGADVAAGSAVERMFQGFEALLDAELRLLRLKIVAAHYRASSCPSPPVSPPPPMRGGFQFAAEIDDVPEPETRVKSLDEIETKSCLRSAEHRGAKGKSAVNFGDSTEKERVKGTSGKKVVKCRFEEPSPSNEGSGQRKESLNRPAIAFEAPAPPGHETDVSDVLGFRGCEAISSVHTQHFKPDFKASCLKREPKKDRTRATTSVVDSDPDSSELEDSPAPGHASPVSSSSMASSKRGSDPKKAAGSAVAKLTNALHARFSLADGGSKPRPIQFEKSPEPSGGWVHNLAKQNSPFDEADEEASDGAADLSVVPSAASAEPNGKGSKPKLRFQSWTEESESGQGDVPRKMDSDDKDETAIGNRKESLTSEKSDVEPSDDGNDLPEVFWVNPVWFEKCTAAKARKNTAAWRTMSTRQSHVFNDADHSDEVHHLFHPDGMYRMSWDIFGCLIFVYDAIFIPLLFLRLPDTLFLIVMPWIVRMYWTFDMFVMFNTGSKMADGAVCMDRRYICNHYLKTWFPFDMVMVCLDWSEIWGGLEEASIARIGKLGKAVKLVRMFRLLKVVHRVSEMVPPNVREYLYSDSVDNVKLVLCILKMVLMVSWVCHTLACFWCSFADTTDSWAVADGLQDAPISYLYVRSFMWALSQFTGQSNIYPTNQVESIFSLFATVITFVVSVSAVSSMTTQMTQIQIVAERNGVMFAQLRQYLFHHKISRPLALRVERTAHIAVREMKKSTSESSVELFHLLSDPLKIELRYEATIETLKKNWFFHYYDQMYRSATQTVCWQCISMVRVHKGDRLFDVGELPESPNMYFLMMGILEYTRGYTMQRLNPGDYACEAVLWTPWSHRGMLKATTTATVVALSAIKFTSVVSQFLSFDADPRKYGKAFVKHLNSVNKEDLSDLPDPNFEAKAHALKALDCNGVLSAFENKESVASAKFFGMLPAMRTSVKSATVGVDDMPFAN